MGGAPDVVPDLVRACSSAIPKLKFGITEGGAYWANDMLWHMDTRYLGAHTSKKMSRDGIAGQLTMKPSEYFDRNCFVGASNMEVIELERRYMIGVGNMLWGNDFPHPEGTWPHTREWLKRCTTTSRSTRPARCSVSMQPRSTTSTSRRSAEARR